MMGSSPSQTEREREREHAGNSGSPHKNNYMKITDYTPGGVMKQVVVTRKPPDYTPETSGGINFRDFS